MIFRVAHCNRDSCLPLGSGGNVFGLFESVVCGRPVLETAVISRVPGDVREHRPVPVPHGAGAGGMSKYARRVPRRLPPRHSLALDAGLRKGELCGLQWRDLDLERGTVSVARQLLKTGMKPEFGPSRTTCQGRSSYQPEWLIC